MDISKYLQKGIVMVVTPQSYVIVRLHPEIDIHSICIAYCICYGIPVPETHEARCEYIRKHRHHESPLEHSIATVLFKLNLGISHQLVRHRHTAYTQESTRYCNYSKARFGKSLEFIEDSHVIENADAFELWLKGREADEQEYFTRLNLGQKPEEARGCLPKDLCTRLMVSTNFREWRSIFKLRCDSHAHYQMREVMIPLLKEFKNTVPCVFEDIEC